MARSTLACRKHTLLAVLMSLVNTKNKQTELTSKTINMENHTNCVLQYLANLWHVATQTTEQGMTHSLTP